VGRGKGRKRSRVRRRRRLQWWPQGEAMVRAKLNMLHREKRELSRALADAKRDQREAAEEERAARAAAKRGILRNAELVVTTLNGCGGTCTPRAWG